MPDIKITELPALLGANTATNDVIEIVDVSTDTSSKITRDELKAGMALNLVDNTSDASKPISTATQAALNLKEDTANKSTSVNTDQASNTKFPSVKAVYDWAVALFAGKQDTLVSGTNIKTVNSTSLLGSGNIVIAGGGGTWGSITGTLSSQADLQTALDGKVDENIAITGATKTKITYDAKGLVTSGADATTADIAASTDKNYVTDAQSVVIGNTSGTNTGDNATNSQYSGLAASKQDALVSGTNIKTIEGQSLLGSGNIDLVKGDIGLGNVDNTSDASKPISTATQTALDAKSNKLITTNRQTASYTLVLGDADKLVEMNVAGANNLTVPPNSSVAFSIGTQIMIAQYGAGETTVVAGSGVTIRSSGGKLKLNVQYAGATLTKIATDEWYLFGEIKA